MTQDDAKWLEAAHEAAETAYLAEEHEGLAFDGAVTAGIRAYLALRDGEATEGATFQARVQPWMMACFGAEISSDKVERGDRLLEEILELLQSGGYDPARVAALRDYVWSRPAGEPSQEVGGVQVTLAAYCLAHSLDMHEAGETELARIWTKVDKIRAKQAAKPVGSALPVAALTRNAEPVVAIKPLEWEEYPGDGEVMHEGTGERRRYLARALHQFGSYCLMEKDGRYSVKSDYTSDDEYLTESAAKGVAQHDYETRIRSALFATLPVAQTGVVGISDAMVERALDEAGSAWGMHLKRDDKAKLMRAAIEAALSAPTVEALHNFQTNGPGIIGSDLCTVCGKERQDHVRKDSL